MNVLTMSLNLNRREVMRAMRRDSLVIRVSEEQGWLLLSKPALRSAILRTLLRDVDGYSFFIGSLGG